MSKSVYVDGKCVRLATDQIIGAGTEADVYRIGPELALKLFKGPEHPDIKGDPVACEAALRRCEEHQLKLPAFPTNLPQRVVAPASFAQGKAGGPIVGYTMPLVTPAERLKCYRPERHIAGELLLDLANTVQNLHRSGVVVGDFTPMNILARGKEAYLIDADSFQFGGFLCQMFTENYVDPLVCDPIESIPVPIKPHGVATDLFALAVITMEVLLGVTPYHGGVCKRKGVLHRARPMQRITIFDADVIYPKQALHFRILPDDLLSYFHATFQQDIRQSLPIETIERMRWSKCGCGTEHARTVCPVCGIPHGRARVSPGVFTRGNLTAEVIFETDGRIQKAWMHRGTPTYLVQESGRTFQVQDKTKLEVNKAVVLGATLFQGTLVLLEPNAATFTNGSVEPIDDYRGNPQIVSNSKYAYWAKGGFLWEYDGRNRRLITEVLRRQTRIWVSEELGLSFYRAGGLQGMFLYFPGRNGIVQCEELKLGNCELLEMSVVFSADKIAWVMLGVKRGSRIIHYLAALNAKGRLVFMEELEAIAGGMHGACAGPTALFVPTDLGILRIKAEGYAQTLFALTVDFMAPETRLLLSQSGILAVNKQKTIELRLG